MFHVKARMRAASYTKAWEWDTSAHARPREVTRAPLPTSVTIASVQPLRRTQLELAGGLLVEARKHQVFVAVFLGLGLGGGVQDVFRDLAKMLCLLLFHRMPPSYSLDPRANPSPGRPKWLSGQDAQK